MPNLALEAGGKVLVIDTDKITLKRVKDIAAGLTEIKKKRSLFNEYPMVKKSNGDLESAEEWEKRVEPLLAAKEKKQDEESFDDFLTRRLTPDLSGLEIIVEILTLFASLFDNQSDKITPDFIDNLCYPAAKGFIRDILKMCDLNTSGFE